MSNIAYAPAAGYSAESCGVIALGDSSLDVRAALKKGGGVIVVAEHDTATVARLDDYPALERVAEPKPKQSTKKTDDKPKEG